MAIFKEGLTLELLNKQSRNTMVEHLGIEFTAFGDDFIEATMPVDGRTRQPFGLLHGGASVALAETLGSVGAWLVLPQGGGRTVGLEINANHVRAVREGTVTGTARPLHLGRTTQVWEIRVEDAGGKLCCVSRITLAVVPE